MGWRFCRYQSAASRPAGTASWPKRGGAGTAVGVYSDLMIPSDFHPVVRQWWNQRFRVERYGETHVMPPTEAQLEGWSAIVAASTR